jgi:hypothetical protein
MLEKIIDEYWKVVHEEGADYEKFESLIISAFYSGKQEEAQKRLDNFRQDDTLNK